MKVYFAVNKINIYTIARSGKIMMLWALVMHVMTE